LDVSHLGYYNILERPFAIPNVSFWDADQPDEAAKTSAMPLDMALEMFVVELAGK
jgi:hypothetical protein